MRGPDVEAIAIIGMGCRFPGAQNPEAFWQLLHQGEDAITEVPPERWNIDEYYDPEPGTVGKMSTRWGGFLEQVDQFDPSFFGISPREVERMDPQQRLVLEVAWEAIENAGLDPKALSGSQTGVFMGIGNYDYCRLLAQDPSQINAYDGTGNTLSIAANRLSYTLNLRGPSVVVETACSSSLVALHFACRSLQSGESDACLVGGVSLMLSPEPFITYSHAHMMAADGRCKTFDARADGYVRGEGCGVVVLKRLTDAIKAGDTVLAVVRGTAVNQDGLSNGLTAPNGPSQQAVIRLALKNAGVTPAQISYVETHGTGTSLGDPIEFKSLKAVLMADRSVDQPCWLGSLKTNIGHLEAASGIASVIKVVLSLQHQEIPPHLHLQELNPYISLEGTTFSIPSERQPWWVSTERRLAGVSAFGFGGTNCHVVLEEAPVLPVWLSSELKREFTAPDAKQSAQNRQQLLDQINNQISDSVCDRTSHLLTLSAKTEPALRQLAQRYAEFLDTHSEVSLADICFTANTGRSHFDHRLAVVTDSVEHLYDQLTAFGSGQAATGAVHHHTSSKKRPKIAFLFTGQGSQYEGMGRHLYQTQPIFRQAIDRCSEILHAYLEQPLLDVMFAPAESTLLHQTAYTQPALFALEYALFQLWKSWGIEPAAAMGHSVGEYVAACVAGVFSLEDGLKLIAERGRLMQALPAEGEMVVVFAPETEVAAAIKPYVQVEIAAINGPKCIVISGQQREVEAAIAPLQARGIRTQPLQVSHAFHSPLMQPMLAEFEQVAAAVHYSPPQIKLISNVTGEGVTDAIATPEYWCQHVCQPVRFAQSLETLHQQKYALFLEVGPKPTLIGMGRYCLAEATADGAPIQWLPSLRPGRNEGQQMLQSLATLYGQGVAVNWASFDQPYPRRRLQLPTYPFQRQRYWVDIPTVPKTSEHSSALAHLLHGDTQHLVKQLQAAGTLSQDELKLLPKLLDLLVKQDQQQQTAASIQDWLYEIAWQPQPRQVKPAVENGGRSLGHWLIFADTAGVGRALATRLQEQGHRCSLVYPGTTYAEEAGIWRINPAQAADFDRLFQALGQHLDLTGIVHLWSLEAASVPPTLFSLEQAQTLGVGSLLPLLQSLANPDNALGQNQQAHPRLWLATQGAVAVGAALTGVAQAPLWGLGKVVALEYPDWWGGLIDVAADPETASLQLLAELDDALGEDQIAFHEGTRYVARLVRKSLPEPQSLSLQPEGTYLITGGLGALGLKLAHWMVAQGARQLVLTGRQQASPEAQAMVNQLEQSGVSVLIAQADVSSEVDMTRLFEQIKTSLPPLLGVVHAAGVSRYEAIADMEPSALTAVLRPKLVGTWILHQLTQEMSLDFFVSFSSISSVWGSKGQAHYAAANQFLDALAHYRHGLGLPALSVNWGPWAGGGMALEEFQVWLTRMGIEALQPNQAIAALGYLLTAGSVQTTVANVDWARFKDLFEARGKRPLLEGLGASPTVLTPTAESSAAGQPSAIVQQLEQAAGCDRYSLLKTYLQQAVATVLRLPDLPDPEQGLFDLGMDSLMAVELVSSLRAQLQVELPIADFMQASHISALTALLLRQISPEDVPEQEPIEGAVSGLNLSEEAVLDSAIYPSAATFEPTEASTILLTGATGFLGAFLLKEMLQQTEATLYCLVRATDAEHGLKKIQANLDTYFFPQKYDSSRIVPIVGDLSQPRLGLSDAQFGELAQKVDVIYHNGAVLNFVYPYSALKSANVLGTQEILRLACQSKTKPLHYVSTDAVFDSSAYYGREVTESEPTLHTDGIDLGYTQTKWVSEKLVTLAGDRGLPVTIYRPPLIAGDSQTGLWNTDDFTCRFLKGCIQMGSMPDMNCGITLVPVDYVSQAIVYLSRQPESIGKAFHLNNPNFSSWSGVAEAINQCGYPVRQIPYDAWEAELIASTTAADAGTHALNGLLPFFLRRWSDEQLTFAGLGQRRAKLNCQATVASLANTAIACPPVDSRLINTYFSYLIRSGFLQAPRVEVSSLS
ncbi:type I polyketide synthase [Pseudanabaena sp. FACHB-2040]|uniref:type I polyketide synthase n=1 Tax=Pseudanabaena sp. FACHB-2040 TaxID=2692859 RepID=UPI001689C01B|nr:thioester reductase domain-containing protein [Pseudanabaena sp. FACHB-2040]